MTALPEDDELLAAELALGLIGGAERRVASDRLATEPAFAEAHARWQAHAAAMFADSGEPPPASIWRQIMLRLPANDVAAAVSLRSLRWWQAGALTATAAACALGLVALRQPKTVLVPVAVQQGPAAPMVAVLTGRTGSATISFDPVSRRIVSATSGVILGKHSPELWVIPADGKPRSLGVISVTAPGWAQIPAAAAPAMAAGVTIAISVEPVGGSTTGQPTGPVILTGKMIAT